jgi:hypothetical protein
MLPDGTASGAYVLRCYAEKSLAVKILRSGKRASSKKLMVAAVTLPLIAMQADPEQ